ncbi:type IV pilus major pilin [Salmonella enterica subsp. enterica serovar Infantis]|nr:type IV pilus major pilin [Salmonella enterica subsp. enterica serovar Infantis]ECO1013569.1 type IV pilus major pilin [Salmonella enterica subsp. enterica serovar Newport]EGI5078249.1 type IV pilus major pilin [Salmonella enterica subsp. enterica serovar Infantis]
MLIKNKIQLLNNRILKKQSQLQKQRKQLGMSLLEAIISLGVIGTNTAGVAILAQRAIDSHEISELVNNINTIRFAMKETYQRGGIYPAYVSPLTLTPDTIKTTPDAIAVSQLVKLGKITPDEVRNNISGDFIGIGRANSNTARSTVSVGFAMEINGLNQKQCRSVLEQVGNSWDYVAVGTSGAGSYSLTYNGVNMNDASNGITIMRSAGTGGQEYLNSGKILNTCNATINSIILAGR